MKNNSYILAETLANGHKCAIIVTGLKRASLNTKTGNMAQVYILLADVDPITAVKTGLDAQSICDGCPFAADNGCYVNLGQSVMAVYKAYKKGLYDRLCPCDYRQAFAGRKVRFGAYGNPSHIPIAILRAIAGICDGWTGYFHNWREMSEARRNAYGQYLMASTETEASRCQAESMGLRYFHASPNQPGGTIECLSDSRGIQCADCRFCAGLSKRGKSVWIRPHGMGAKKANQIALSY